MLIRRPSHHLAQFIVRIRLRAEQEHSLVLLGAAQEIVQPLGALAHAGNEDARRERVERAPVSDFHVQALRAPAAALVVVLAVSARALDFEPWCEERGGVEVGLEVADYFGGGDALGFVDGWCVGKGFR